MTTTHKEIQNESTKVPVKVYYNTQTTKIETTTTTQELQL